MNAEEQHVKDLERIKNFRLLDDDFMTKVFDGSIEETQLVLRIILDDENLKVISAEAQYTIANLQGRSVRLDVRVQDGTGRVFDVEIQRADKGAGAKRARHNGSLIDANSLRRNVDPAMLPEVYIIFITENDVLKKGLPLYHIERIIKETGEEFGDEEHIIYVNGAYQGDDQIGYLMSDFRESDPSKMHYPLLAERARYFKETEEGRNAMCKVIEDMREEVREETRRETMLEHARQVYQALLNDGMNPEKASLLSGLKEAEAAVATV